MGEQDRLATADCETPNRHPAAALARHGVAQPRLAAGPFRNQPPALQQMSALDALRSSPRVLQQQSALAALRTPSTSNSPAQGHADVPTTNASRLPDGLRTGIESMSGLSMDQVTVHYNSTAPAQLSALAFAQGPAIHLGPGQEQHLPHEAWHVVQQAQGRVTATHAPTGGVAINDDPALELEADQMGRQAQQAAGRPRQMKAAVPAGRQTSGVAPQRRAVLQRATDREALAQTQALPEFQFEPMGTRTVEELIDRRDAQMGGVARDANKNNLVKRGFEEALATFVFHRWDLIGPVVLQVSRMVLRYFEQREQVKRIKVLESMQAIQEKPETLGSPGFRPQSTEEGTQILLDQIPQSLPTHLNVHGKFSYVIYSGKGKDFDDGTSAKVLEALELPNEDHFETLFPPALSRSDKVDNPDLGRPRLAHPKKDSSLAPHLSGLNPERANEKEKLAVPPEIDGRPTYSSQEHSRGGDAFVLDETKRWTQQARLLYDMPVMAGPSGSAAYMLNTAMVLGLSREQLHLYTMALVGSIVGGGHHTFHEIMTVAAHVGIPYIPGDYLSAIPPGFWRDRGFQDLVHQFYESTTDFSQRTRSDEHTPSAQTAHELQFGLPPMVDDNMASMARSIAARLGQDPSNISIRPINDGSDTKGVSGSPVFMVELKTPRRPIGVVKVFREFTEMAQELSAMSTVEQLGLPNFVAPRVLGVGKLTKGNPNGSLVKDKELGYVISSIADGQALDDLMKAVGTTEGEPRETAFRQLTQAVGDVAGQLAELHQAQGSGGKVGAQFIQHHVEKVLSYAKQAAENPAVLDMLDGFSLVTCATRISEGFQGNPGPAALAHGDAHPGNFFHKGHKVTAIDTPTMDMSIGKNAPVGSPARDVVNFRIKLATVGRLFQLTNEEIGLLQQRFDTAYGSSSKLPPITAEARAFFALRTLLSELKTAITDNKVDEMGRAIAAIKELK